MSNIERIEKLASAVDVDMQEDVESVVINAGKYVAAVTEMECSVRNMQGLKGQDYRDRVSQTDTARTRAHNAFIDAVIFFLKLYIFAYCLNFQLIVLMLVLHYLLLRR